MESYDAGAPEDAGQAPEHEAGGAQQGPDPNAIADTLHDELAQGYGDEAEQGDEEEQYERPTIGEIAAEQRDQRALMANLVEEHPGIQTAAAVEAIRPIYEEAIAAYPELNGDLDLVREIYDELGGDQRFAGDLVAQEYAQAFPAQSTVFEVDKSGNPVRTDPLTS